MRYTPAALLLLALAVSAHPLLVQTSSPATPQRDATARIIQPRATPRPLPEAVSDQTLELPGHQIQFTAAVEFIRLLDAKNAPKADINITHTCSKALTR